MAKSAPNLTSHEPNAEGERNFVKIHKIKKVTADIINTAKKVKTFDRAANRFGNDEDASIAKYDAVAETVASVMSKVLKRVNHQNTKKVKPVKVAEGKENEFKVGDNVHIGLRIRGGAGWRGTLEAIDENGMAKVRISDKDYTGHPRHVRGHLSRVTKEEVVPETPPIVETAVEESKGLLDFETLVKELSSDTLSSYVKKADKSGNKLDASADKSLRAAADSKPNSKERDSNVDNYQKTKKKADKRFGSINLALDKIHDKSQSTNEDLHEDYHPDIEFHVVHKDGGVKGKYGSIKRARSGKDRCDNSHGGYAHHIKYYNKTNKQYVDFKEAAK